MSFETFSLSHSRSGVQLREMRESRILDGGCTGRFVPGERRGRVGRHIKS